MKNLLIAVACLSGCLLAPATVHASNYPSYSYLQASTQSWELLDFTDLTGPGVTLSIELGDTLFVTAQGLQISEEESAAAYSIKDEFEVASLGLGFRSSTVNKTSWYLSLTHEKWKWDTIETFLGVTDIDTIKPERNVLRVGFRSQLNRSIELNGSILRYDLDLKNGDEFDSSDTFTGTSIQIGMSFQFIEDLHLLLDYSKSQSDLEYESLKLGLRYSF